MYKLKLRSQQLGRDERDFQIWKVEEKIEEISPSNTAFIICDVWDKHRCYSANVRSEKIIPRIAKTVEVARQRGTLIFHCPSLVIGYYKNFEAFKRMENELVNYKRKAFVAKTKKSPPDCPLEVGRESCETSGSKSKSVTEEKLTWRRQHPDIRIDNKKDVISIDGSLISHYLDYRNIQYVFIAGFHLNVCLLMQQFGIKSMVNLGKSMLLLRDLTDSFYNPKHAPYVSHEEGTQIAIGYVEKFWCPSLLSKDIIEDY